MLTAHRGREATVSDGIAESQVVGIDLHLHRSVIARIDERGNELGWIRVDNDPKTLIAECRKAGRGAPVAIEATYGWYWAVDALLAARFEVHLAHPLGLKALQAQAGQDRPARRVRVGDPAAARVVAGGLHRPAGPAGASGTRAAPPAAGEAVHLGQGRDAGAVG